MGTINENIISNDISFQNLERLLNFILSQEKNKSQNIKTLKDIGLAKQYTYLTNNERSKEIKYISKSHKTLKNYKTVSKDKSYFIKWTNLLFDIKEKDYNCYPYYTTKIHVLRNKLLTKAFFQENVKKNLIDNTSNIKLFKYGIPKYLREFIWEIIIAENYSNKKYFNHEEEKKEFNTFINNFNKNNINKQIEKDLTRTFLDITDQKDKKIHNLKNLLIYSSSLIKDGYCQGMNFIVGFILRFTNFDEIKSFYFIKYIFPKIKGYFEQGFPLLKKNINIFHKLFSKLYPKLNSHFTKNDVFAQFWVGKWFQTLYTLNLPFEELCYMWDLLLIKGFDFSIYINLAIIHYLEKYLIKLDDSSDILQYLQNALNPEPSNSIDINSVNDPYKYIIPLSEVFQKALEVEDHIKNDKALNDIITNSKNEESESICSRNTKETETSILNTRFNSNNNSSISFKSFNSGSNISQNSLLSSRNDIPNNIRISAPKKDGFNSIGNNTSNNVNINNNFYHNNKNIYAYSEKKKVYRLFENIDLTKRSPNDGNVNNYLCCNLGNYYSINTPILSPNYFYVNHIPLINHKASYSTYY